MHGFFLKAMPSKFESFFVHRYLWFLRLSLELQDVQRLCTLSIACLGRHVQLAVWDADVFPKR